MRGRDVLPTVHRYGRGFGGDGVNGRGTLYLLLAVVAGAAAMLSFAALRDLALLCGFSRALAWLLPVVVDAGAAAGSLVWLRPATGADARLFARRLALGLLGLSVVANALGHGLAAYALAPPWWVVVVLSGIAPAVLGAMVHLGVLVGRPAVDGDPGDVDEPAASPTSGDEIDGFPWAWDTTPAASLAADGEDDGDERVAALIAAGAGRRRLSRELGVTEYEGRRLLERTRTEAVTAGQGAQA